MVKKTEDIFIRFDTMQERDRHTHRQTHTSWRHRPHLCIASRGKNVTKILNIYSNMKSEDTDVSQNV